MTNATIKKEIERIQNLPQIKAQRKATKKDEERAFEILRAMTTYKTGARENSLDLNEREDIQEVIGAYTDIFQYMIWKCNKNLVTLYLNDKQVIELLISNRTNRISTRKEYNGATAFDYRNSGYGLDYTKKCATVDELKTTLQDVVKEVVGR